MKRRELLKASVALAAARFIPTTIHAAPQQPYSIPSQAPAADFPKSFIWGSATASYQIEGAAKEDGKGESVWDRFSHTVGKIKGEATGDTACDSYHRYKEDIGLMRQLNLRSYRFSIAWPRIQPSGAGAVHEKGLDYYKRLVDALLAAGIRPFPTLYHWDLPQALEDKGGWPNRELVARFTEYAQIVTKALGDRVKVWSIFNEPWVFTFLGYFLGIHAPGRKSFADFLRASHVVNLAQGEAFRAMKAINPKLEIGTAFSMSNQEPATDSEADQKAADRGHALGNLWFLETALNGRYPEAFVDGLLEKEMGIASGDMEKVRAPLDFLGINNYSRNIVRHDPNVPGTQANSEFANGPGPKTEFGWEIAPDSFRKLLVRIAKEYPGKPIEITENGCAYDDSPDERGLVIDDRRIRFYRAYLAAMNTAMKLGAPIRAYYAWSLLDNFEWAEGYSQRFGLVYVNFRSQRRTIKDSGDWYAKVAASSHLT